MTASTCGARNQRFRPLRHKSLTSSATGSVRDLRPLRGSLLFTTLSACIFAIFLRDFFVVLAALRSFARGFLCARSGFFVRGDEAVFACADKVISTRLFKSREDKRAVFGTEILKERSLLGFFLRRAGNVNLLHCHGVKLRVEHTG